MIQYLQLLFAAKFPERDERGASAVEYGLLVAGIAALVVLVVLFLGDSILGSFTETCSSIQNGNDTGACVDQGNRN